MVIADEIKLEKLCRAIAQVEDLYHRLVLLTAPAGQGKTAALRKLAQQDGCSYININLELSRRLLELTERQRLLKTPQVLREVVETVSAQIVLLDNLELLFDQTLKQDPLRLLQGISRNLTVVAAWNGTVENGFLTYARIGHPEYRAYPARELFIVSPEI